MIRLGDAFLMLALSVLFLHLIEWIGMMMTCPFNFESSNNTSMKAPQECIQAYTPYPGRRKRSVDGHIRYKYDPFYVPYFPRITGAVIRPSFDYFMIIDLKIRQAAAYGFGVMGMNDGPVYARACVEALPRLCTMIGAPNSRAPENNTATENAVSAVTKILKYNNSCLDNIDKYNGSTSARIAEDTEETPNVYGYLCDLIESYNPVIIGQDNANVPNVIKLFTDAFAKSSIEVDSVVGQRMILILRHVQTIPTIFQTCMNVLTNEERQALENALNAKTSPQNYQTGSSNHIMNHHHHHHHVP
ncbi:unnamed protein product [Rotaria magnacalcarata]|uniref:Uncharacterized protein n=5 Tax=Rotaria magnacalcarata TaxID=392030 RepID=A0A8S2PR15_9BILA|nr:unnamed protein product [Rotaria magnacalcarata]